MKGNQSQMVVRCIATLSASDLSVKFYSMGGVRKVVPSISSAVSAIEARDGNESQLIFSYKK